MDVLYYSTDGMIHKGQIVLDKRLASDVTQVFEAAFQYKFPFVSVVPISQFDWNDDDSMSHNNTSSFNYRAVTGGKKLSNHSFGFAIDINPLNNPYLKGDTVLPKGAKYDIKEAGTLTEDSPVVRIFLELGWLWGGHWKSLKDYQHFEKVIE